MQGVVRAQVSVMLAAAAVGTGAIAAAPARIVVVPEMALAAFHSPLEQLAGTAEMAQNYLLAGYYNGGDAPTPGAGEANWPYAGMDQTGGDALNYLLYHTYSLGHYQAVGLLPQINTEPFPAFRQFSANVFDYLNRALTGLTSAVGFIAQGQWAQAAESLITQIKYITGAFAARASALIKALPQIVSTAVAASVAGLGLVVRKSAAIVTGTVKDLASGNLEGAWNTAVDGALGPSGLPGTVLNLTVGSGLQTGPIIDPQKDIPTNFVPSTRTVAQSTGWTIQSALATPPPPMAAVRVPAGRKASSTGTALPAASRSAAAPEHHARAERSARAAAHG